MFLLFTVLLVSFLAIHCYVECPIFFEMLILLLPFPRLSDIEVLLLVYFVSICSFQFRKEEMFAESLDEMDDSREVVQRLVDEYQVGLKMKY